MTRDSRRAWLNRNLLWLLLGAVFYTFAVPVCRWSIPLAAWLAPVFLMRFVRTTKPLVGFILLVLATSIAGAIAFMGVIPMIPLGAQAAIATVGASLIGLIYFAERLLVKPDSSFWSTLIFPAGVAAQEFINSLGHPFGTWGVSTYSQFGDLPLMQLASVTGIWGISFLVAWLAPVVNWVWEGGLGGSRVRTAVLVYGGVLVAVFAFGGGRLMLADHREASTVRIAGVTPSDRTSEGLTQDLIDLLDSGKEPDAPVLRRLRQTAATRADELFMLSEQEARAGARIIVWPETSIIVLKNDETSLVERAQEFSRNNGVFLGMGIGTITAGAAKPFRNHLVLVAEDGSIAFDYTKTKPILGPRDRISQPSDGKLMVVETPYGRLSGMICFDADFPRLGHQVGDLETDIVVLPASDWKEINPIHTEMASFRAVEQGVGLVRQAQGGLSAAFDSHGRMLASMNHYQTKDRVLVAQMPTRGISTIYGMFGDSFACLCAVGFLVTVGRGIFLWLKRRRETR